MAVLFQYFVALVLSLVGNESLFLTLVGEVNVERYWVCAGMAPGGILLVHLGDFWVHVDDSAFLEKVLARFVVHADG